MSEKRKCFERGAARRDGNRSTLRGDPAPGSHVRLAGSVGAYGIGVLFLPHGDLVMDLSTAQSTGLRVTVLGLLLALSVNAGVFAQSTVSVRGNVGASFFRSPEVRSETLHSGEALGLEVGVRLYRGWAVILQGGYDRFTLNQETTRLFNNRVEAGDLFFLNGSLGLRYTYLNDSDAHPFFSTAFGRYRAKSPNWRVYESGQVVREEELVLRRWGAHLGVGSLFRLNQRYAVVFEPRYVFFDLSQGITDAARYFTLRLGLDVQL